MIKKKLLYFSATRICSGRANMIQTIYTYKYFSEKIDSIFLYPAREKDHIYEKLSVEDSLRDFFGNNFSINNLIRINTLDIPYIKKLNKRLWFYLLMISYCLNSIRFVASSKTKYIYTREPILIWFLILSKKLFRLKTELIYESHNESILDAFISKNVNKVVCISKYLFSLFKNKYNFPSLILAEDAAELGFKIDYKLPVCVEKIFNLLDKKKKLVYVGSTFEHKGYNFLIKCSNTIPKDFHLILIGGNKLEAQKHFKLINKSKVTIINSLEHKYISKILLMADGLILPNLDHPKNKSTSPLKMYEYLASNKPIFFSDIDIFQEILEKQPLCFSFASGNISDFIKQIKTYFNLEKPNEIKREVNSWEKRSEMILRYIIS